MRELSRLRSANANVAVASGAVERENAELRARLAAVERAAITVGALESPAASQWRPR